jgi:hypothetical protein
MQVHNFARLEKMYRSTLSSMNETLAIAKKEILLLKKDFEAMKEDQDCSGRVISTFMSYTLSRSMATLARELQASLALIFFLITHNFDPKILDAMGDSAIDTKISPLCPMPPSVCQKVYQCAFIYSDDWKQFRKCGLSYLPYFKFDYFLVDDLVSSDDLQQPTLRPSFSFFLSDFAIHPDKYWVKVAANLAAYLDITTHLSTDCHVSEDIIADGAFQRPDRTVHVIQELIFRGSTDHLVPEKSEMKNTNHEKDSDNSGFELPWLEDSLLDVLAHHDNIPLTAAREFWVLWSCVRKQPPMNLDASIVTQLLLLRDPCSSNATDIGHPIAEKDEQVQSNEQKSIVMLSKLDSLEQTVVPSEIRSSNTTDEDQHPSPSIGKARDYPSYSQDPSVDYEPDVQSNGAVTNSQPSELESSSECKSTTNSNSKKSRSNGSSMQKKKPRKNYLNLLPFEDVHLHFLTLTDGEKQELPDRFHDLGWHVELRLFACMTCYCLIRSKNVGHIDQHIQAEDHHTDACKTNALEPELLNKKLQKQLGRWQEVSFERGFKRDPVIPKFDPHDKKLPKKIPGLPVRKGWLCKAQKNGLACGWATHSDITAQIHVFKHAGRHAHYSFKNYFTPANVQKAFLKMPCMAVEDDSCAEDDVSQ